MKYLNSNVHGSNYGYAGDALHRGHVHARASLHYDHEDGYAYLRYGNTFAFTSNYCINTVMQY